MSGDSNGPDVQINVAPERDRNIEHRLTRLEVMVGFLVATTVGQWALGSPVTSAVLALFT